MSKKDTLATAGTLLLIVAVTHFVRAILAWEITVDGIMIPFWVSYVIIVVAGALGVQAIRWSQRVF